MPAIEHNTRLHALMFDNIMAPADQIIRRLYDMGCKHVYDPDTHGSFRDAEQVLRYWYDVDMMTLEFTLPDGQPGWILFVHQHGVTQPHCDDIADFNEHLKRDPILGPLLHEDYYHPCYRSNA